MLVSVSRNLTYLNVIEGLLLVSTLNNSSLIEDVDVGLLTQRSSHIPM
jgi:hypothetical protein